MHPELAGTGQTPLAPARCPHALGARPCRWETCRHFAVLGRLPRYGEKRARAIWGFLCEQSPWSLCTDWGRSKLQNRHHFLNDAQRRRSERQRASRRWATSRNPQLPMAFREQSASSLCSTMPRSDQWKAETAHHSRPNRNQRAERRQRAARRQRAFLKMVSVEISFSETPFVRRMQDSFFRNVFCGASGSGWCLQAGRNGSRGRWCPRHNGTGKGPTAGWLSVPR